MKVFILPDLGEGLHEVELVSWHVSVGDHVVADQPLVSVETEKAVVEIPAPHSGRIGKLHGQPGDIVKVGAPLVEFEEAGGREDVGTVLPEVAATPVAEAQYTAKPIDEQAKRLGAARAKQYARTGTGDAATQAAFVAYIDGLVGLGLVGEGSHAPGETADLKSLDRQATRAALLITRLSKEPRK